MRAVFKWHLVQGQSAPRPTRADTLMTGRWYSWQSRLCDGKDKWYQEISARNEVFMGLGGCIIHVLLHTDEKGTSKDMSQMAVPFRRILILILKGLEICGNWTDFWWRSLASIPVSIIWRFHNKYIQSKSFCQSVKTTQTQCWNKKACGEFLHGPLVLVTSSLPHLMSIVCPTLLSHGPKHPKIQRRPQEYKVV